MENKKEKVSKSKTKKTVKEEIKEKDVNKKTIKRIFIIIIPLIILIILIDTLQARILKNSPFFSIKKELKDNSYVNKGLLMDTYYCEMNKDTISVDWQFKFNKFDCPIYDNNKDVGSEFRTSNNIISLSIKDNSLTKTGLTLIMKNNTNSKFYYGAIYYVEHYENNKWNLMRVMSGTMMAYGFRPNQQIEEKLDWSNIYGELPNGKYRIVRNFLKNNNHSYEINSSVEFEIK